VAGATRLVTGAGGASQVLNFGSLAYVANCYGELHPLKEATSVDNESPALSPPLILLGADLKVLTH
jgi:hypothetical protein